MLDFRFMKKLLGLSLVALMLPVSHALAATQSMTASAEFVTPVSLSSAVNLRFGLLDVGFAGIETIVIAPGGTVTDAASRVVGGTQGQGSVTVTATAAQTITILVDNVGTATGYTLATWKCSYNSGTDTVCDGGGMTATSVASATLNIGATMTRKATPIVGTDNSTFDVTVLYQ